MRVTTRMLSVFLLFALVGMATGDHRARTSSVHASEPAQDAVYLDRRISTLEMRLSTIESSLRSLEQQAMSSQRMTQGQPNRDPETSLLRSEVEMLKIRLRELECGLVHLDERTLSVAAREARKRTSGQSTDPCRLNPEAPVQLSPHR
jgi:predicted  nucleic acid-binding Zn-ribbon protein